MSSLAFQDPFLVGDLAADSVAVLVGDLATDSVAVLVGDLATDSVAFATTVLLGDSVVILVDGIFFATYNGVTMALLDNNDTVTLVGVALNAVASISSG